MKQNIIKTKNMKKKEIEPFNCELNSLLKNINKLKDILEEKHKSPINQDIIIIEKKQTEKHLEQKVTIRAENKTTVFTLKTYS